MDRILDFSQGIDINLLDQVVSVFYDGKGSPAERKNAEEVLKKFQDSPEAWTVSDQILERSQNAQSKYIALSTMDNLIQTRWKALPADQRIGIRNFVIGLCVGWSNDEQTFLTQKPLINKANLTLVQILKQEWPDQWPTFIPDVIAASRNGSNICENNMTILKLLSEEVFDFSSERMTQLKIKTLKKQMCAEFAGIFQLCFEVLEKATRPSLILATLQSLLRYLNWIPLGYIFDTTIVELLIRKYLPPPEFRNVTLKCLTEIAALNQPQYEKMFYGMFVAAVQEINNIIPLDTDFRNAYETSSSRDQEFIQNLGLFFSTFLSHHLNIVESQEKNLVINVNFYLIKIAQIDEREIFKVCLDYWSRLVLELYEEIQQIPISDLNPVMHNFTGNFNQGGAVNPELLANYPLRKHMYSEVLSKLRLVMIEKMVRPEEVLIVENDEGEIVREFVKESDTITLYKSMREVLVYLTHLDVVDTELIMTEKLAKQIDGSEWSWNNLNTLCWAIGSISGAMNEEMEKRFLVTVIKDLLGLTEMKRGKDNKAVVASNIMYIVGQYPRFLKAHWRFLKTVVNKLFEFMHETHEGVQDMACDTFIKIAQKCRRHFVAQQQGETEPFIDEIVRNLPKITSILQPQQVQTFYEACGHIIVAQPVKAIRERLLNDLMSPPNQAWTSIIQQSSTNPEIITSPEYIKIISNVMKTNVAACSSLGAAFYPQLTFIYMDSLRLYRSVSQMISDSVVQQGPVATKTPRVRGLRTIKKEVLKLIESYVSKAENLEEIVDNITEPLLAAVLDDYKRNVPDAREAEVLNCMNTLVSRVGRLIPDMVLTILDNVFECTLDMIDKTMYDYPEHRVEFFKLLRTINLKSFSALLKLPENIFSKTIDACLWASKHDNREVESVGLNLILEIVNNMASLNNEISSKFFQKFFKPIIGDTFYVLTDNDHKAGFKTQTQILAKIIELTESNSIPAPLYLDGEAPAGTSNSDYFRQYLGTSLMSAYPHLKEIQVSNFIQGIFSLHNDANKFKLAVRDFLVELKEFGGDSTEYLFAEEKESELLEKQKAERERALKVGGLLKPSEMDDDL